jgi:hypothetical protein
MRWPKLVPGRSVGTLLLVGGALCAAPATIWPTNTITFTPAPDQVAQGAVAQRIAFWSWGRVADATPGTTDPTIDFGSAWGLVVLLVALLVGVVAAGAYTFRPGPDGVVLGATGASWLVAGLAAGAGQTAGRMQSYFAGFIEGLSDATTFVGVLQLLSLGLLLAALAMMVGRSLATTTQVASARLTRLARSVQRRPAPDRDLPGAGASPAAGAPAGLPRVGIATFRDVEPGARPGWGGRSVGTDGRGHGADGRTGVGFSDDDTAPTTPGSPSDSERFRPPR